MIVLACPACARQYDVTHLDPGSRVRCVCDATFTVSRPSHLAVAALVCTHCGGPVGPEDAGCPYCGAALSAGDRRESMLCPACFVRLAAGARHCRACGVEIAPQALTPIPDGRLCPRCGGELGIRDLGRASVVDCLDCGGLWLPPRTFEAICRRAGEEEVVLPPGIRNEGEEPPHRTMEDVRYIPCLTCGQLMNRRQFRYRDAPSTVVIDLCRDHGVWLDHGELERVAAFVRSGAHRDRPAAGSRPPRPEARDPRAGDLPGVPRTGTRSILDAVESLGRLLFG